MSEHASGKLRKTIESREKEKKERVRRKERERRKRGERLRRERKREKKERRKKEREKRKRGKNVLSRVGYQKELLNWHDLSLFIFSDQTFWCKMFSTSSSIWVLKKRLFFSKGGFFPFLVLFQKKERISFFLSSFSFFLFQNVNEPTKKNLEIESQEFFLFFCTRLFDVFLFLFFLQEPEKSSQTFLEFSIALEKA